MKLKVHCPVCQVSFLNQNTVNQGDIIVCPVCGAKLVMTGLAGNEIKVNKPVQEPKDEINDRIETFARLRNYGFNEDKETVLEGLLQKKDRYGDFYCPCRFDNIAENICPCLETRSGQVNKEGNCY